MRTTHGALRADDFAAPSAPASLDLSMLEVSSRCNASRRVSYPVNPMRRFCAGGAVAVTPTAAGARLVTVAALLDWAYGYRGSRSPDQRRPRRRAPSAGALYPIECFVLGHADGAWRTYYYDCAQRLYRPIDQSAAGDVARWVVADPDTTVVVLASVLWRSAQRYGARSYLYSSLDAGNIVGNLVTAARHYGIEIELTRRSMTQQQERLIGLRDGEGALVSLALRDDGASAATPPTAPAIAMSGAGLLQAPSLSPVLSRVSRFHARTLSPQRLPLVLQFGRDGTDYPRVIERRHSSAAFAARALDDETVAAMADRCSELLRTTADGGGPRMRASVVTVRTPEGSAGAHAVRRDGSLADCRRPLRDLDDAAGRLVQACQNQEIVRGSAFGVVIGVDLRSLTTFGHEGYRAAALSAGMLCASLYREAARRGIGTTSIGGFHSQPIRDIVGAGTWWPLAVQVFGVEATGSAKVDAAVIPLNHTERNER